MPVFTLVGIKMITAQQARDNFDTEAYRTTFMGDIESKILFASRRGSYHLSVPAPDWANKKVCERVIDDLKGFGYSADYYNLNRTFNINWEK